MTRKITNINISHLAIHLAQLPSGVEELVHGAVSASQEEDCHFAEELEPIAVDTPFLSRDGWATPIAPEVYAIGRGVTITRQPSRSGRSEGLLEFEAHGKFITLDVNGSVKSHRFIHPIKGDVAAVLHSLQTMDQEDFAEMKLSLVHRTPLSVETSQSLARTVVLALPRGVGKTTIAQELAEVFDCRCIVDCWSPEDHFLVVGALHLTSSVDEI